MSDTETPSMMRRAFGAAATGALAAATATPSGAGAEAATGSTSSAESGSFWPNGTRLAISISLMFEAGGQPISGAGGPLSEPIKADVPDQPTNAYVAYEGIPRALDLFDKHDIKVTSFMSRRPRPACRDPHRVTPVLFRSP